MRHEAMYAKRFGQRFNSNDSSNQLQPIFTYPPIGQLTSSFFRIVSYIRADRTLISPFDHFKLYFVAVQVTRKFKKEIEEGRAKSFNTVYYKEDDVLQAVIGRVLPDRMVKIALKFCGYLVALGSKEAVFTVPSILCPRYNPTGRLRFILLMVTPSIIYREKDGAPLHDVIPTHVHSGTIQSHFSVQYKNES